MQHPSKGVFGFLKKNAIIVVTCKKPVSKNKVKEEVHDIPTEEESVASEIIATVKEEETKQKSHR